MSDAVEKTITAAELNEHSAQKDLWLQIDGKVYDVSKFMDEHPGGDEVLLCEAGKDATEAFEDVGHSDDARDLLGPMFVGNMDGAVSKPKTKTSQVNKDPTSVTNSNPLLMFLPLILLGAWVAYRNFA